MARLDPQDINAPIPAPEGCATSEEHEAWFTELSDEIRESADGDSKLLAEAIKARRAAHACAIERESNVILARLDRNKRAMAASNGAQRAPLRVVSGGHDR